MMTANLSNFLQSKEKTAKVIEFLLLAAVFFLPFSKALLEICITISLIAWFFKKIKEKESLCHDQSIMLISGVMIIASSVSAFHSGYPLLSARGIIKIVKYVLIMLLVTDVFSSRNALKRLLVVGFIGFSAVVANSYFQYFQFFGRENLVDPALNIHRLSNSIVRLTGPYSVYGLLAAHLIAVLPVLFSFVISLKKVRWWARLGWWGYFLISVFLLYKTHSRGALIASFVSWVIYALCSRNRLMLIMLALIMMVTPFIVPRNVLLHVDRFNQEQSIIERNLLWSRAIQVIQARPLFGCGINTYIKNYPKFATKQNWRIFNWSVDVQHHSELEKQPGWTIPGNDAQLPQYYVHNGYLQMAAETGLISLSLFLLILGAALKSGFQAFRSTHDYNRKSMAVGLLTGFVALLLQAGVDTTLHNIQSATLIWFFAGILFAVKCIPEKD